jgi:RNA polymerase sigma-70 factor (ECF subfamily)
VPVEDLDTILATEGFEEVLAARMDVERLLESLPPKQARAIRDTHVGGLSVSEAARGAGIGVSDVKVSVHRGLEALIARMRGGK